jgi:ubiquinone/menaquinone biosynthesis C-methylase UbiE
MQISNPNINLTCTDADIYNEIFDFTDKSILELGCGSAAHARKIAELHRKCHINALEVDKIQHEKNLSNDAPPNITFVEASAQDIPFDANTVDIVFMFKSLHHVPIDFMDTAMQEIKRVLKPGGMAYISEPIFAGEYNEIMRIFHDEEVVRKHAFAAVKKAVESNLMNLKEEIFFKTESKKESFEIFKNEILNRTFVEHKLDDETWANVEEMFEKNMTEDGAVFLQPHRVDLLESKTIL